jgi:hypothetical protein
LRLRDEGSRGSRRRRGWPLAEDRGEERKERRRERRDEADM